MPTTDLQLFVFDMAGTTVDEDNVVYKTLQRAIAEEGVTLSLDTVLAIGAGQEKKMAIRDLLHHAGLSDPELQEQTDQTYDRFVPALEDAYRSLDVRPITGAIDIFTHLRQRGIRIALNTGYQKATALGLLAQLDWQEGREFDLLVTADMVERARPAPDMIEYARHRLAVTDPQRVAKIGDSAIDIEEGRNANCGLVLGITTGAQTEAQLQQARPDAVIHELSAIRHWLDAADRPDA